MHPKQLKKYTFKNLTKIAVWFTTSVAIYGGISNYSKKNNDAHENAKANLQSVDSKNAKIKMRLESVRIATDAWNQEIKQRQNSREGLQIKRAQHLLDKLRIFYKIKNLSLKLSTPETRIDISSKYTEIQYSTLNIEFSADYDVTAFLFLNGILEEMPGYIKLMDMNITAIESIDESVLLSLKASQDVEIVKVKAEFLWQDMLDKPKTEGQKK